MAQIHKSTEYSHYTKALVLFCQAGARHSEPPLQP